MLQIKQKLYEIISSSSKNLYIFSSTDIFHHLNTIFHPWFLWGTMVSSLLLSQQKCLLNKMQKSDFRTLAVEINETTIET